MTADTNGHATIREVFALTKEVRDELISAMEKMEERLISAITENRDERRTWIEAHERVVHGALNARHDDEDVRRTERAAQKRLLSGCTDYVENHWKVLLSAAGIGAVLVEVLSHMRIG